MGRVAALVAVALLLGATACGERKADRRRRRALPGDGDDRTADRRRSPGQADRRPRRGASILDGLGVGRRIVLRDTDGNVDVRAVRRAARPDRRLAGRERARPVPGGFEDRARVYTVPGDSIRQVERAITQLGLLTGDPSRRDASSTGSRIAATRSAIAWRGSPASRLRRHTGFLNTVPDQSLIGDVLRRRTGQTCSGRSRTPARWTWTTCCASTRRSTSQPPDAEVTLKDLRSGRTRKLRAVRNGRFAIANQALLSPALASGTV